MATQTQPRPTFSEPVRVFCYDECGWPERTVRRSLATQLADLHDRTHAHGVGIHPVTEGEFAQWHTRTLATAQRRRANRARP